MWEIVNPTDPIKAIRFRPVQGPNGVCYVPLKWKTYKMQITDGGRVFTLTYHSKNDTWSWQYPPTLEYPAIPNMKDRYGSPVPDTLSPKVEKRGQVFTFNTIGDLMRFLTPFMKVQSFGIIAHFVNATR